MGEKVGGWSEDEADEYSLMWRFFAQKEHFTRPFLTHLPSQERIP